MKHVRLLAVLPFVALVALTCATGTGGGGYLKPARADFQRQSQDAAVTGYVVDLNCWLNEGSIGTQHRACVDRGSSIAILTDQGSLILPVTSDENAGPQKSNGLLAALVGKRATLQGRSLVQPQTDLAFSVSAQTKHVVSRRPRSVRPHSVRVNQAFPRGVAVSSAQESSDQPPPPQFEAAVNPDTEIIAQVVNLNCMLADANASPDNRACEVKSTKLGHQLVMVGEDGKVYFPVVAETPGKPLNANDQLLQYTEWTVRARGRLIRRASQNAFMISEVAFAEQ